MMSQHSKQELINAIRPRYQKAKKIEKQQILNEFVATTGYHRKYAIRVLKQIGHGKHAKKPGPQKIYPGEVVVVLGRI